MIADNMPPPYLVKVTIKNRSEVVDKSRAEGWRHVTKVDFKTHARDKVFVGTSLDQKEHTLPVGALVAHGMPVEVGVDGDLPVIRSLIEFFEVQVSDESPQIGKLVRVLPADDVVWYGNSHFSCAMTAVHLLLQEKQLKELAWEVTKLPAESQTAHGFLWYAAKRGVDPQVSYLCLPDNNIGMAILTALNEQTDTLRKIWRAQVVEESLRFAAEDLRESGEVMTSRGAALRDIVAQIPT
jgi:hypothetical protein